LTASERTRHALNLFAPIASSYDRAGALLSLGRERGWRDQLVGAVPAGSGQVVLDVACGTGLVSAELRRRFAGDPDVTLVQASAEALPFDDASVDHLTVTYLLRYVDDPAAQLRELVRVIRPGGTFASLEFGVPTTGPLRWGWQAYTRFALPAIGRLVSPEWAEAGRFLHGSIPDFYRRVPLDRLIDLHRAAGLRDLRVVHPTLGSAVIITGTSSPNVPVVGR
jgi:demethylmenaquinone methyltransferase / 2-methoxy-6-polyprenyl-1,4-benzoquinol methylase